MSPEERRYVEAYLQAVEVRPQRQRRPPPKGCCAHCRRQARQWHHIIPYSEGGTDDESNLQPVCDACHTRHHSHQDDYRRAGRWGGLISAYKRERRMGRKAFCQYMRQLAMRRAR